MHLEKGEGKVRFVKVNGRYLYSPYDPFREIERLLSTMNVSPLSFGVVFGSAQGYVIQSLLSRGVKEENIWVYEPHPELSQWTREHFPSLPMDNLFSHLERALLNGNKPILIALEGYKRIFADEYNRFESYYSSILRQVIENIKVTTFFGRLWWINYMRNYALASKRGYRYVPSSLPRQASSVLVTASGPSLNKKKEDIKRWYQKGGAIIACLSSWPTLFQNDIKPWAVVVSDAGIANKLHALNLPPEVIVFASVYANSSLLASLPNPIILYDHEKEGFSPSFVLSEPSVIIPALTLARQLFSGRIVVAGLDLSYTIWGTHAQGNTLSTLALLNTNRFKTPENRETSFLARNDIHEYAPGVWTTPAFELIHHQFEELFPQVEILHSNLEWKNPTLTTLFSPEAFSPSFVFPLIEKSSDCLKKAEETLNNENSSLYQRDTLVGMEKTITKSYLKDKFVRNTL